MTPQQREDLDLEIQRIDNSHEWKPYNRRSTDENKWIAWICAMLFVPIILIVGAEILFHVVAWLR